MWALIQFSDNPHEGFTLYKTSCWKLFSRLLISDSRDTQKNKHSIASIVLQFKLGTKIGRWVKARDCFLLFLLFWGRWKTWLQCFYFLCCISIFICPCARCLSSPYRKCYAVAVDRSDKSNHSTPVMVISVSSLYSALERSFPLCPAE